MKAIIAAGGRGTRIRPITWTMNKHLIPLANKPMIVHAMEKVKSAGITDIILNVNPGDTEMSTALGDGSRYGVHITYVEQQGGAKGVAHVPKNSEHLLSGGPFLFYIGDNIVRGDLVRFVNRFKEEELHCMLAFSRVKDPQRFGVPKFCADGSLECIIEKPTDPPSDYAVTGIYLYDEQFFDAFNSLQPSARGEYEISDINTWYIKNGKKVGWEEITGWWKDTGKPEDLLEGNALIMDEMTRAQFENAGSVDASARIQGLVHIGAGTVIGPNALIRGPVVIGERCQINNAYIGPYTAIGNDVKIEGSEIEHSIILDGAHVETPERIVDSILGHQSTVVSSNSTLPPSGHRLVVGDNSVVEL
jgi:glucose-1-phosphate thymidylyltransferase